MGHTSIRIIQVATLVLQTIGVQAEYKIHVLVVGFHLQVQVRQVIAKFLVQVGIITILAGHIITVAKAVQVQFLGVQHVHQALGVIAVKAGIMHGVALVNHVNPTVAHVHLTHGAIVVIVDTGHGMEIAILAVPAVTAALVVQAVIHVQLGGI